MIKSFVLLIFSFFIVDSYACQMKLKIFNELEYSFLRKSALIELEKKSYIASEGPSLLLEIKAFKRNDYHDSKLKYPFVSVVVRSVDNNEMLNYVHGNGLSYKSPSIAYSENNFINALNKAISHLPICK